MNKCIVMEEMEPGRSSEVSSTFICQVKQPGTGTGQLQTSLLDVCFFQTHF